MELKLVIEIGVTPQLAKMFSQFMGTAMPNEAAGKDAEVAARTEAETPVATAEKVRRTRSAKGESAPAAEPEQTTSASAGPASEPTQGTTSSATVDPFAASPKTPEPKNDDPFATAPAAEEPADDGDPVTIKDLNDAATAAMSKVKAAGVKKILEDADFKNANGQPVSNLREIQEKDWRRAVDVLRAAA